MFGFVMELCSGEGALGGGSSSRCSCWLQGHPGVPAHTWDSPGSHSTVLSQGCTQPWVCTLLLSQSLPASPKAAASPAVLFLPPSLSMAHAFSASSPANQPLHHSRDSICDVWRRFCLKLGSALQSRVHHHPSFPKSLFRDIA